MFSEPLDLLVRHQGEVLATVGVLGASVVLFTVWKGRAAEYRREARRYSASRGKSRGDDIALRYEVDGFTQPPRLASFWGWLTRNYRHQPVLMLGSVAWVLGIIGWFGIVTKQPIVSLTVALEAPALEAARSPTRPDKLLILLHGWNGQADATWAQFPNLIKSDPRLASYAVWVVDYPTFIARRNLTIKQMAHWLNEVMDQRAYFRDYKDIYVIAHSMGGLVARELVLTDRLARNSGAFKVMVSIASPYEGATLAALLSELGLSRGFADDLRPGSPTLVALRDAWNVLGPARPVTHCLTSPHDLVVTEDSAISQCMQYVRYPQWGHSEMVKPVDEHDPRYETPVSRVLAGTPSWPSPLHGVSSSPPVRN